MLQKIKDAAAQAFPQVLACRRYLHQNPRLSFQEQDTAGYICTSLENWGLSYERCGLNGVVTRLKGKAPGPCIAFRADFDALPIQEPEGLPYASRIPGVMHACGHDAHCALLLNLVDIFRRHQDWIRGELVFIFQYAEELPPGGALPMIQDGCLEGVDRIYGLHVSDELDSGTVGICSGKYMAASDHFTALFTGPGGHGSRPSDTQDTVSAAATAVLQINAIPSRFISPLNGAVVSVCMIQGGQVYNVMPSQVRLEGTVRTYEPETAAQIREHISHIVQASAQMYGTGWDLSFEYGYPPVINSEIGAEAVRQAARKLGLPLKEIPPTPVGEDFSRYLQKVPGAFFRIGIRNESLGAIYPLHDRRFTMDEAALQPALEQLLGIYMIETWQL